MLDRFPRLAKPDFSGADAPGIRRIREAAFLLPIGFALWMLANPFRGIWHDGRFYTLMALRRLDPQAYASDPWFMFGSQDDYSVFSAIYAPLIDGLGLATAAMIMALAGGAAFVGAAFVFSRGFLGGRYAQVLFLLLSSIPLSYLPSQAGVLTVSESIVTARTLSVACSLCALTAVAGKRWGLAVMASIVSLVLHPLMAFGGIVVALMAFLRWRTITVMALLCGLVILAAALLGWTPLGRMDDFWFRLVDQTSIIVVFPDRKHDPTALYYIGVALAGGVFFGTSRLRRWYFAALAVGATGYGVSLLAGAVYPVTLLLQTQPWRAIWVALVFAVLAVTDLSRYLFAPEIRVRAASHVAVAAVSLASYVGPWGLLAWFALVRFGSRQLSRLIPHERIDSVCRMAILISSILVVSSLPSIVVSMLSVGNGLEWWLQRTGNPLADGILATGGFGLFALTFVAVASRLREIGLAITGIVMLWMCAVGWDIRGDDQTRLGPSYGAAGETRLFGEYIRRGDTVYARRNVERVWFEVGTASYAGSAQAVGIVLNRQLAIAIYSRLMHVISAMGNGGLGMREAGGHQGAADVVFAHRAPDRRYDLHQFEARDKEIDLRISPAALNALCADSALHWVIDSGMIPELAVASETVVAADGTTERLALYSCDRIRQT